MAIAIVNLLGQRPSCGTRAPGFGRAFLPPQPRTNGYFWRHSVNRLFTGAINHHAVVLAA
jgi:hypothetical protein